MQSVCVTLKSASFLLARPVSSSDVHNTWKQKRYCLVSFFQTVIGDLLTPCFLYTRMLGIINRLHIGFLLSKDCSVVLDACWEQQEMNYST